MRIVPSKLRQGLRIADETLNGAVNGLPIRLVSQWASVDPEMSVSTPGQGQNLGKPPSYSYDSNKLNGSWVGTKQQREIVDPWNGDVMLKIPDTQQNEIGDFKESLNKCPKTGLHNPYKNPERYYMYGEICKNAAREIAKPETTDFFIRLIQRVAPKHATQAAGEVNTVRKWLESFSGDSVRLMARGFSQAGDHTGQISHGVRWPFGPVAIITPFNFPLEIPAIQTLSALFMGNKPVVHVDHRVSIVQEQFIRLLQHAGMPKEDCDYFQGNGQVFGELLKEAHPRSTLFTGSQRVAEKLSVDLAGKVFLEDAGFDWKILGPDVDKVDYVAWQCDQDAYACSGQKCSAQSLLFMHKNWAEAGLVEKLKQRAAGRKREDQSIGPVLSWSSDKMLEHKDKLLQIPGSKLLFGGKKLQGHEKIPAQYGFIEPTAVFVPLKEALKEQNFGDVTKEVFGPFQVVTQYDSSEIDLVLEATERLSHHLTAAIVSNDIQFVNYVLANTVNGTTYAGIRARTTGAPQNHWFGPAGDPRGAGIHTPEAIRLVWSCHREIIHDFGPITTDTSSLLTT